MRGRQNILLASAACLVSDQSIPSGAKQHASFGIPIGRSLVGELNGLSDGMEGKAVNHGIGDLEVHFPTVCTEPRCYLTSIQATFRWVWHTLRGIFGGSLTVPRSDQVRRNRRCSVSR